MIDVSRIANHLQAALLAKEAIEQKGEGPSIDVDLKLRPNVVVRLRARRFPRTLFKLELLPYGAVTRELEVEAPPIMENLTHALRTLLIDCKGRAFVGP